MKNARTLEEIRTHVKSTCNEGAAPEYIEGLSLLLWCAENDFIAQRDAEEVEGDGPEDAGLPGEDEGPEGVVIAYLDGAAYGW